MKKQFLKSWGGAVFSQKKNIPPPSFLKKTFYNLAGFHFIF